MSQANPLRGAPRIHGELLKLGVTVSQATVSKYMLRPLRPPSRAWRRFLKNHAKDLIALDFFTVPTATFRVLFVLVTVTHKRRRLVHLNVTEHPTAEWTARQLLQACGLEEAPRYLIRDRDQVYRERFWRQAKTYVAYYNGARTHLSLVKDAPEPRKCTATESGEGGGGATRRWAPSRIPAAGGVSRSD